MSTAVLQYLYKTDLLEEDKIKSLYDFKDTADL